jgi:RNA polymerase sigma-70 factor (ECF subfamily)
MLRTHPVAGAIDWTTVYEAELPRVLNFFRYRVGDLATAEDLTAHTFEKAWTKRERYDDRGKFAAWLMTIARNVATDHYRRRRPALPIEAALTHKDSSDPAKEFELKEQRFRLTAMLSRLPERHQELIALKYGAELTNREIARLLDLTESNVGTILHRLILQLRSEWEAEQ